MISRAIRVVGEFVGGALFFASIGAVIYISGALLETPATDQRTTERCFDRPIDGTVYRRRQAGWGPGQGRPCDE